MYVGGSRILHMLLSFCPQYVEAALDVQIRGYLDKSDTGIIYTESYVNRYVHVCTTGHKLSGIASLFAMYNWLSNQFLAKSCLLWNSLIGGACTLVQPIVEDRCLVYICI